MNERELRGVIEDVRQLRLSRRAFTRRMIGLGLTAPLAAQMLASSGVAVAAEKPIYSPTKRGGGGAVKVLWWQAPTLLNPHFATGTKDQDGSRVFYEPLAGWDADGDLARCSPPRSRASRMAVSPRTACRSPGSSSRASNGTTASRSRPTTASSIGSTPPIRRLRRRPSDPIRTSMWSRSTTTRFAWSSRSRHRSGRTPSSGPPACCSPSTSLNHTRGAKSREAPANLAPDRHRPVPVRGFQAGRPGARQAQPGLPPGEPAVLRHPRDEGRRRCGVGRARCDANRRVRFRLEYAGRGRDPEATGDRRQGPRRDHRHAATSSISRSTAPTLGRRLTVNGQASRRSIRFLRTLRFATRSTCWSIEPRCTNSSTAAPASTPPTS